MRARVRVARRRRNYYAEITPPGAVINFDRYRAKSRDGSEKGGARDERAARLLLRDDA